jgi:hypothetical protein
MRKTYATPSVTEHGGAVVNTLGMIGGISETHTRLP